MDSIRISCEAGGYIWITACRMAEDAVSNDVCIITLACMLHHYHHVECILVIACSSKLSLGVCCDR